MYQNIVNWFIYLLLDKNSNESMLIHKGFDRTKPVFGVSNKAGLKQISSATKTSLKFGISLVASLDDTFQKGNN